MIKCISYSRWKLTKFLIVQKETTDKTTTKKPLKFHQFLEDFKKTGWLIWTIWKYFKMTHYFMIFIKSIIHQYTRVRLNLRLSFPLPDLTSFSKPVFSHKYSMLKKHYIACLRSNYIKANIKISIRQWDVRSGGTEQKNDTSKMILQEYQSQRYGSALLNNKELYLGTD